MCMSVRGLYGLGYSKMELNKYDSIPHRIMVFPHPDELPCMKEYVGTVVGTDKGYYQYAIVQPDDPSKPKVKINLDVHPWASLDPIK